MIKALEIFEMYASDLSFAANMSDQELENFIIDDWKKLDNDWFINYFEDQEPDLEIITTLLETLKLEVTEEVLNSLVDKSSKFSIYLKEYANNHEIISEKASKFLEIYNKNQKMPNDFELLPASAKIMLNREINKIPVMSDKETKEYIRKYQDLVKLTENTTDELEKDKLLKEANSIINIIAEGNIRLIRKFAYKKAAATGLYWEDLITPGFEGIKKAIEKFDLHVENTFSTYATTWIKQKIDRYIMENEQNIRIPAHAIESRNKLKRYLEECKARNYTPSNQEISKKLNITEGQVEILLSSLGGSISLDSFVGDDEKTTFGEMTPDSNAINPEDAYIESSNKDEVKKYILKLRDSRQNFVIKMRYGLIDGRYYILSEVGAFLNVTRERARQIEDKALRKLRNPNVRIDRWYFSYFFLQEEVELATKIAMGLPPKYKKLLELRFGSRLNELKPMSEAGLLKVYYIIDFIYDRIIDEKYLTKSNTKKIGQADNFDNKTLKEILECSEEEFNKLTNILNNYPDFAYEVQVHFGADYDLKVKINVRNEDSVIDTINHCISVLDYIRREENGVLKPLSNNKESKWNGRFLNEILGIDYDTLILLMSITPKSYSLFILNKMFGNDYKRPFNSNLLDTNEALFVSNFISYRISIIKKYEKRVNEFDKLSLKDILGDNYNFIIKECKLSNSSYYAFLEKVHGKDLSQPLNVNLLEFSEVVCYGIIIEILNGNKKALKIEWRGKTFEEIVGKNREKILDFLTPLNNDLIKQFHGEDGYGGFNVNGKNKDVYPKYYFMIRNLRKNINMADSVDEFEGKTLEEILGLPFEDIVYIAKKSKFKVSKYGNLPLGWGEDYKSPLSTAGLTYKEKLNIYKWLKTIENNKQYLQEKVGEESIVKLAANGLSTVTISAFKEAIKDVPIEYRPILELALGIYNKNKMYSVLEISELFHADIEIIRKKIDEGTPLFIESLEKTNLTVDGKSEDFLDLAKNTLKRLR